MPTYFPVSQLRAQARAQLPIPATSFAGQTIIFIGATGTICAAAARLLVSLGVETLILGVRNPAKGNALANELLELADKDGTRKGTDGKKLSVLVWELDLFSFASVKSFAAKAAEELRRLDVVIMGAGVFNKRRVATKDGWEQALQANHLSSALLELLLLPTLIRSARTNSHIAVLTNISSWGIRSCYPWMRMPDGAMRTSTTSEEKSPVDSATSLNTPLLRLTDSWPWYHHQQQYGKTKLVHLQFLRELSAQVANLATATPPTLTIQSVDPGTTTSPITEVATASRILGKVIGRPAEICGQTVVNASDPFGGANHGKLFVDYDVAEYPLFLDSAKGLAMRKTIWEETISVLTQVAPEVPAILEELQRTPVIATVNVTTPTVVETAASDAA